MKTTLLTGAIAALVATATIHAEDLWNYGPLGKPNPLETAASKKEAAMFERQRAELEAKRQTELMEKILRELEARKALELEAAKKAKTTVITR